MAESRFLGRRQEACHQCRERRVRCGKERPGCGECAARSLICPGYLPKISLDFKDESGLAAQKVQARKRKQAEADLLSHSPSGSASGGRSPASDGPASSPFGPLATVSPTRVPPLPIRDIAISYFTTQDLQGSLLGGITELYSDTNTNSLLFTTACAPALASLAIDSNQPQLMTLARSHYAQALHRTNLALSDSAQCATDETLASILHLGFFEGILYEDRTVQKNWTAHVAGALEILRIRGRRQFQTYVGRELYVVAIMGVLFSCIQGNIKITAELRKLEKLAAEFLDPDHPTYRLCPILEVYADFQHARRSGKSTPSAMIERSLHLDETIAAAYANDHEIKLLGQSFADRQQIMAARRSVTLLLLRMMLNGWTQRFLAMKEHAQKVLDQEDLQLRGAAQQRMTAMAVDILETARKFIAPRITVRSRFLVLPVYCVCQEPLMPAGLKTRAEALVKLLGVEGKIPEALRASQRIEVFRQMQAQK
ncbi:hypothetical protein GQ53DRAFT_744086 [Thozetella sp. PMI_491]|nr:hypothetical protein GQ53DRAFT_744086 [Thozetella sp. PMI_491]